MKRVIIIGASSGIGKALTQLYLSQGDRVGITGRRLPLLEEIESSHPEQVFVQQMDITLPEAADRLRQLAETMGGMDLCIVCSGIGTQNRQLIPEEELRTVETNSIGFTRMVTAAFNYFRQQGHGQLAVISSIAGTKGLGVSPSYSATKRFQSVYIQSLAQLATIEKLNIRFTTIFPGFIHTDLLKQGSYPLTMNLDRASKLIFKAIEKKKRKAVIDTRWRIITFFWKLIPSWLWERMPVTSGNVRTA